MGTTATTGDGTITIVPTNAALGAEVRGVDLRRVMDADFAMIHQAWLVL